MITASFGTSTLLPAEIIFPSRIINVALVNVVFPSFTLIAFVKAKTLLRGSATSFTGNVVCAMVKKNDNKKEKKKNKNLPEDNRRRDLICVGLVVEMDFEFK